ncbi:hypothetical protein A6409_16720 [Prescottella equi]|nr:hypothetical protein A6409_16720 [Prescottella equi]
MEEGGAIFTHSAVGGSRVFDPTVADRQGRPPLGRGDRVGGLNEHCPASGAELHTNLDKRPNVC